jgi:hypothetical protein
MFGGTIYVPVSCQKRYHFIVRHRRSREPNVAINTVEIPCNFVGVFKVGDNLVFNGGMLCDLAKTNTNGSFNKMIVVQAGSMCEAALSQIIYRAQNFNREGVKNISKADQAEIEGKKIDKFNNVIDVMKKYGVLDELGKEIYDELHKLRKYRNKVLIEDTIDIEGVSLDESAAFSDQLAAWAVKLNAKILKHLSEKYSRPKPLDSYVGTLVVPT